MNSNISAHRRQAESAPLPPRAVSPQLAAAASEVLEAIDRLRDLQPAVSAIDPAADPEGADRLFDAWDAAADRLHAAERGLIKAMRRAEVPAFVHAARLFCDPGADVSAGLDEETALVSVFDAAKVGGILPAPTTALRAS